MIHLRNKNFIEILSFPYIYIFLYFTLSQIIDDSTCEKIKFSWKIRVKEKYRKKKNFKRQCIL